MSIEEIRKRSKELVSDFAEFQDETEQHFLESDVIYAQAAEAMFPALAAARHAEIVKKHAAQIDEMDRVIAEMEAAEKAKEAEWAEEDKKGTK